MKKVVSIILLAVILIGSLAMLVLYNIGDYILENSINDALQEAVKDEEMYPHKSGQFEELSDNGKMSTSGEKQENNEQQTTSSINDSDSKEKESSENRASDTGDNETSLKYSSQQVREIKDAISAEDKMAVSKMVLSKLSAHDIKYLNELIKGGLTESEKMTVKKICFARFSEEDIKRIYAFYKKYITT